MLLISYTWVRAVFSELVSSSIRPEPNSIYSKETELIVTPFLAYLEGYFSLKEGLSTVNTEKNDANVDHLFNKLL